MDAALYHSGTGLRIGLVCAASAKLGQKMRDRRWWAMALVGVVICMAAHAHAHVHQKKRAAEKPQNPPAVLKQASDDDEEVKLGRSNAIEHDKTVKLVNDPVLTEKVNRIGQEIAAIANSNPVPAIWGPGPRKAFKYTFKVVDDKDVNAYSLPGGFIYVHKGLLDFVQSDDELAAVLAHEVAHAAHHHMLELIRRQENEQKRVLPILLVLGALSRGTDSLGNLLIATQLYLVAKTNTYGVEAEKDSDQAAVHYLRQTKYNPVGMLTFIERLARQDALRPQVELGIYRTHPPSPERARATLALLEQLNIPIARRTVDASLAAQVSPATINGVTLSEVRMNRVVVARLAPNNGQTAEQRAARLADRLNALFDDGLEMYELRMNPDKTAISARGQIVVQFTPEDAAPQNVPVETLTLGAYDAIRGLIWQERFNRLPLRVGGG